jgi:flagella basal body P-ring formation protein FlgA
MHREYEDLVLLYTTRSLDESGKQRLEEHLRTCETCRASLKEWRALSVAVQRAASQRADSLPALRLPDLEQEKNTMQLTQTFTRSNHYVPVTFAVIAAMLIITVVVLFGRTPGSSLNVLLQPTTVEIVMPTHPIRADRRIDSDDVALVPIPAEVAPANRLTSLEAVIGKFTRTDIFCGQPLLSDMIAEHAPYIPAFHDFLEMNSNEMCNISPNPDDELVNVVVARGAIHRQEPITEDMVELRPYPSQLIPDNAVLNIEDVVDQAAVIDIFQGQFLIEQIISEFIPPPIPESTVMTYVLVDDIESLSFGVQEGDRVTLSMTLFFIDDVDGWRLVTAENPQARSITIPIARNAYVVQIGASENAETADDYKDRIYVEVSLDEAMILSSLVEAQVGITMALTPESASVNFPMQSDQIPEGLVVVSVPKTQILAGPIGQLTDHVDILATLRFADIDEQFQVLIPTGTRPDTQSVTQQIISNALQIPSDDPDMLAFAVSPEDAVVLTWLAEARIPLILVAPGSWAGDPLNIPTIP